MDGLSKRQAELEKKTDELNAQISNKDLKLKSHKEKDKVLIQEGKKKLEEILQTNEGRKLEVIEEEPEDYSKFEQLD